MEMLPVSSETTMAIASVFSVMPIAARCRSPKLLGMSRRVDIGRMQATDLILLCAIIIAPSCSGLFLKKMFSMRREEMAEFIRLRYPKDIKTAADILTDNNAHLARRVLEVIAL